MSLHAASPAPQPSIQALPPATPRPSRLKPPRVVAVAALLFVLLLAATGSLLLFSPPVLQAMTAIVIQPQPGTVPWNGHDRITVVAMGLTQRTTEPARTDTLLVMDIDPSRHHISMLSVPRDLWVDIPGYGKGKLAIAYELGGPKLAAYTLERALNIPVDYTLALTFRGFTKIVDAMGGVTVDVPQELKDPSYPCLTGYDYCPIDIKPGRQHMSGALALEFVRERHAFAQQDLARVKDQQAFSDAAKRQLISPTTWPRYPGILKAFEESLITNLPLNALPEVGAQYVLGALGGVNHSYINAENGMVKPSWSNDGQSILTPSDATSIPNLVNQLFSDPQLAQDNASIAVLNGTSTAGMATDVQSTLQGLNLRTVLAGNADATNYQRTVVVENTVAASPVDYTARRLQRILNADLIRKQIPGQSAQLVVIVGANFPGA